MSTTVFAAVSWSAPAAVALLAGAILWVLSCRLLAAMARPRRRPRKKEAQLPPGSFGWPLVGETLDFVSCAYSPRPEAFVDKRHLLLSVGTPLKSSGYGENCHESKMFALVAPQSLAPGDGSSSSTGAPVPLLLLDSGATIHVVGDAKILTNLRDPPTNMAVTAANGSQLPITKVGVIQAPNINISDVYLAPGLEMNLISVRQLAKSKIISIFYENYADLWLEGELIGRAIANNDMSLYRLWVFKPHA